MTSLAAGGHHTLFVTAGGQLWACGRGKHGALGIGVKGTHSCYYYYEEDQRGAVRGPNDELVPRLVPVHHKPEPENPPLNANEVPRERNTIKRAFKRFEKTRNRTVRDASSNEDVLFAPTPARKGADGGSASATIPPGAPMRFGSSSAIPQGEEPRGDSRALRRREEEERRGGLGGSNAEERRVDQGSVRVRRSVQNRSRRRVATTPPCSPRAAR